VLSFLESIELNEKELAIINDAPTEVEDSICIRNFESSDQLFGKNFASDTV